MSINEQIASLEKKIKELEEFKERTERIVPSFANKDMIQTLSNKVLKTPVIDDFTNATHSHLTSATGGSLSGVSILVASLSGSIVTSAGGTDLVFTNAGTWRGTTSKTSASSADRMLRWTIGGINYWVPAFSAVASG